MRWGSFLLLLLLWVASQAVAVAPRTLLVLGDSLSAAYGMEVDAGWVRLLERRLVREKYDYKVINASISGDTTANGLERLPGLLDEHRPSVVIVELGGNDGLRGLPLEAMQRNLTEMVTLARRAGARVLVIGVELPPNYGPRYLEKFRAVFREAARAGQAGLVPSIVAGFGADRAFMQGDGIHPAANAQPRMLDNVWPRLRPLL